MKLDARITQVRNWCRAYLRYLVLVVIGLLVLTAIKGFCARARNGTLISLSNPARSLEDTVASDNHPETALIEMLDQSIARGVTIEQDDHYHDHDIDIRDAQDDDGWRTIRMRVTAYCACRICCGNNSDGRTANMHRIRPGDVFVAADKKFRFGTEMQIPGYNNGSTVKVYDRGRLIKGNRLDVFFHNHRTAQTWGTKYLDVKVKPKS